jgi:NAD+ synthase (glutamine-hydrolysing)
VVCLNREILLIRPKLDLADDGNYREKRFFTPWKHGYTLFEYMLPEILQQQQKRNTVPFGVGMIRTLDNTVIAIEICEELWSSRSPHIDFATAGAHIICNGSGSHHELRKLHTRVDLIHTATRKNGGLYLYSNHRGCDGQRLYFDGSSMIVLNGELLAQAPQFGLKDVDVITACVDLDEVINFRQSSATLQNYSSYSRVTSASSNSSICHHHHSVTPSPHHSESISTVNANINLRVRTFSRTVFYTKPRLPQYHSPEEECALGPACWL